MNNVWSTENLVFFAVFYGHPDYLPVMLYFGENGVFLPDNNVEGDHLYFAAFNYTSFCPLENCVLTI